MHKNINATEVAFAFRRVKLIKLIKFHLVDSHSPVLLLNDQFLPTAY